MPHLKRTWLAPGGYDGPRWPREKVDAFERLMREASVKTRGAPPLVDAWDNGRDALCWYAARCCLKEAVLRDKVRAIFGQRERDEKVG